MATFRCQGVHSGNLVDILGMLQAVKNLSCISYIYTLSWTLTLSLSAFGTPFSLLEVESFKNYFQNLKDWIFLCELYFREN